MARVNYTKVKETPLKWHRFLQAAGYPISFLIHVYLLIGFFLELLQIANTPFLRLANLLNLFDTPFVLLIVIVYLLVQSSLIGRIWLSSFRWRKSSLYTTWLHTCILAVFDGTAMYYIYHNNLYVLIGMNLHVYTSWSLPSRLVLLLCVLCFIAILMYSILNFFYYFTRRKLYRKSVVTPEEKPKTPEEVTTEQPIILPQAVEQQPEAEVVEIGNEQEEPVEVIMPAQPEISEAQKASGLVSEPVLFEETKENIREENDVQEEIPAEHIMMEQAEENPLAPREPVAEISVEEESQQTPLSEPIEEETALKEEMIVEELPEETVSMTQKEHEEIPVTEGEELKLHREVFYCNQCGMKLKDHAKFCSNCGHKVG